MLRTGSSALRISRMQPLMALMQYIFRAPIINRIKIKPDFNKNDKLNLSIKKRAKTGISRELRIDKARKKF